VGVLKSYLPTGLLWGSVEKVVVDLKPFYRPEGLKCRTPGIKHGEMQRGFRDAAKLAKQVDEGGERELEVVNNFGTRRPQNKEAEDGLERCRGIWAEWSSTTTTISG